MSECIDTAKLAIETAQAFDQMFAAGWLGALVTVGSGFVLGFLAHALLPVERNAQ